MATSEDRKSFCVLHFHVYQSFFTSSVILDAFNRSRILKVCSDFKSKGINLQPKLNQSSNSARRPLRLCDDGREGKQTFLVIGTSATSY